jgi:tetratricopeptide (TPR) repeat protein
VVGCAYELKGSYQEALGEYQKARSLDDSPYVLEWLARAHALSGNQLEANRIIEELGALSSRMYVDSYYLASAYVALGKKRAAIDMLEIARRERSCWLIRLRVDPLFDTLRGIDGFDELLVGIGADL